MNKRTVIWILSLLLILSLIGNFADAGVKRRDWLYSKMRKDLGVPTSMNGAKGARVPLLMAVANRMEKDYMEADKRFDEIEARLAALEVDKAIKKKYDF